MWSLKGTNLYLTDIKQCTKVQILQKKGSYRNFLSCTSLRTKLLKQLTPKKKIHNTIFFKLRKKEQLCEGEMKTVGKRNF